MIIFSQPKSKYKYLFEQSMFDTIWVVFSLLSVFFFLFSIKHFVNNDPNFIVFLGAFFMTFGAVLILKFSGKYQIPVFIGAVLGSIFCQYSIFFVPDHSGVADILWIVLICLFAFYGLGTFFGIIIMVINFAGAIWKYVILDYAADRVITNYQTSVTNSVINILIVCITMIYLIHRIINSSVKANRNFQNANDKLLQQNIQIKAQINEKTALLQEVHHRVKNNLQVISSLIRLQSYETEDEISKKLFETSVNRISAMALIHEKMYQGVDISKINLENYLIALVNDIIKSYEVRVDIIYRVKSELEIIGNRTIVPLALIFNELITNSLKHAFNNQEKGEIKINIEILNDNRFSVDYYDSGEWRDSEKSSSFGLELIDTFTEQLDGKKKRVVDDAGTHYFFNLKNID
jgi:two-component sensor histidine kinase